MPVPGIEPGPSGYGVIVARHTDYSATTTGVTPDVLGGRQKH